MIFRSFKTVFSAFALLSLTTATFGAEAALGETAPGFSLPAVSGEQVALADHKGKIVVLEWTNYDCPFVKKFYKSGEMQKMQKKYTDAGVVWFTVCTSAPGKQGYGTAEEWKERFKASQPAATDLLIDAEGVVGRAYDAKATPQFAIIDQSGNLVYSGAIDSIPSFRVEDIAKAENYVTTVLDDLLAGKQVKPFTTKAYGCSVKY